jgi:hypothetical protein
MSLFQDQDQRASGGLPGEGASCAPPPAYGRGADRDGVLRRGDAVGGRAGLAAASAYVTVIGVYCLLNFLAAGCGLAQAAAARTGRRVLR